jgi:myo-inositol-1(or 4)-monophosphatase
MPLQSLLDIATIAAQAGGAELRRYWGNLTDIQEKGRPGDLVTEADRAAEAAVLSCLKRHCPSHSILAEESGQIGSFDDEYVWVVDPLDGTTNYAHGYPVFAVSIGLVIKGEPAVGVVYNPIAEELYRAAKGLGASCNDRLIHVSQIETLAQSLLVTGFAYDRHSTPDNNYGEFCHLTHLTQGVRRSGSAAMDLSQVACGRLDGYWERGLSPWDLAAGIVLVREAGGSVTAYDGSPFDFASGRILATNDLIHADLSQELLQVKPLGRIDRCGDAPVLK